MNGGFISGKKAKALTDNFRWGNAFSNSYIEHLTNKKDAQTIVVYFGYSKRSWFWNLGAERILNFFFSRFDLKIVMCALDEKGKVIDEQFLQRADPWPP